MLIKGQDTKGRRSLAASAALSVRTDGAEEPRPPAPP
jgi:hypothetical protein